MSLINIAKAGRFSADRAVQEYAENIWGIKPLDDTL
jgi:starch phosphorylase